MKKVVLCFIIFFNNPNSLEDLITSLEIKSSKVISNYFDSNSEIIINEKVSKGNKFQLTKTLDNFFTENNLRDFKIIHKGDSQNNIFYMLAEYSSNDDIYKVFLTLLKDEKKYIIQKFKIDIKE
tara:strand:- start:288 stop:659 length:372 start_codon:yes stop_codon:yes gene_type:complete